MKLVFALMVMLAVTLAKPQQESEEPYGGYMSGYETGQNIMAEEVDSSSNAEIAEDGKLMIAEGSYSYVSPDGIVYTVNPHTDKN